MSHANARLTAHGRRLIVERRAAGWTPSSIAAAMGCSRKTVYGWLARFAAEGDEGLHDRSSRPTASPTRTSPAVEAVVVRLRTTQRLGRDALARIVGVSARTASRIIVRHGLPPLSSLDPMTGAVIRASRQTTVRYERDRPGELVHMDVKKLGKIPDGGGWRGRGETPANHQSRPDRASRPGYDFVHSLVDDHSRFAYSEVLPDEQGVTCAAFLERALTAFAAAGIGHVERLITDNAWAYRYSLRDLCARHGIIQKFIRPHCPWQNGKVERFNRTLQSEWAYARVFLSSAERAAALAPWLEHYNTRRHHSALNGPPTSRLSPTS